MTRSAATRRRRDVLIDEGLSRADVHRGQPHARQHLRHVLSRPDRGVLAPVRRRGLELLPGHCVVAGGAALLIAIQVDRSPDLRRVVAAEPGHGPDVAQREPELLVGAWTEARHALQPEIRVPFKQVGDVEWREPARRRLTIDEGLDRHEARRLAILVGLHRGVLRIDEVLNGRKARVAPARLRIPHEIEAAPVEARDERDDLRHRGPARREPARRNGGEPRADDPLEVAVGQRRLVGKPSPEQEAVPHLVDDELTRRVGFGAQELAPPRVAIRPHVETGNPRQVRQAREVGAGEAWIAPAHVVHVVVAHREPRGLAGRNRVEPAVLVDEQRPRGRVHVRLGVLEAERQRRVGRVIPRELPELRDDVAEVRLVGAVDQPDHATGPVIRAGRVLRVGHRVGDTQSIGLPEPPLLLRGSRALVAHVLARGDADRREQGVGIEQRADGRANVVARCLVVERVSDVVAARLGAVHEGVPGEDGDVDATIAGVGHDGSPEGNLLVDRHDLHRLERPTRVEHLLPPKRGVPEGP